MKPPPTENKFCRVELCCRTCSHQHVAAPCGTCTRNKAYSDRWARGDQYDVELADSCMIHGERGQAERAERDMRYPPGRYNSMICTCPPGVGWNVDARKNARLYPDLHGGEPTVWVVSLPDDPDAEPSQ